MITKKINGNEVLLVTVPEDAVKFYISYLNELRYTTKPPHKMDWQSLEIKLEVGEYEIIGKASDLTERQWQWVVRELPVRDRYENYLGDYPIFYHNAKESGLSLLKSNDLDPKKTIVVIKN